MYNLLFALLAAFGSFVCLAAPRLLSPLEASLPAVLVFVIAYVLLARRTFRQLEAILQAGAAILQRQPPQFERGIAQIRRGYSLKWWQFGVRTQVDAQLGMLQFLLRNFKQAEPLLARAYLLSPWLAGAMLAVIQYKRKDTPAMRKTMGIVTRKAKQQGLAWNLYAYLLDQTGQRDEAIRVLNQAVRHAGGDLRVKESLSALKNGRKIKMRGYSEQWYQFHLERPPTVRMSGHAPGRFPSMPQRGRF